MRASLSAELLKLRSRPGTWVLSGTWLLLVLAFGFGIPFIVYLALGDDPSREGLIVGLLPDRIPTTGASLFPLFGGPIMLILGALSSGSEYRWGTWGPSVTQHPTRTSVFAGKAVALAVALAAVVVATWVVVALASTGVAAASGRETGWPSPVDVGQAMGAAWLISLAWGTFGLALGVVLRNSAAAIAVGLVWGLGIENAISGLAFAAPVFETLQRALVTANSGSLVSALGAPLQGDAGGTPGVVEVASGPQAALVLAVYTVVFAVVAAGLLRRRDLV